MKQLEEAGAKAVIESDCPGGAVVWGKELRFLGGKDAFAYLFFGY